MRHEPLDIDSDLRKARTLPAWFYRSERVHAWLNERLLSRSWQLVSHLGRVDPITRGEPGAWPFRFLPGSVDEPLLLTRDEHGCVYCLSNVCTRRGSTIVAEPCEAADLRCPYHGCRFALDGQMLEMPGFDDAIDFPAPSDDLPRLPLVGFGEFLFTAIDPAWPFAELVEQVTELAGHLPWVDAKLEPAGTAADELDANWLLCCDNYLDGHRVAEAERERCETRLTAWSSVRIVGARSGQPSIPPSPEAPPGFEAPAAMHFFLFPNIMLDVLPWGLSITVIEPLAVERTRVRYEAWVWAPELYEAEGNPNLGEIDRELVLRAQAGVRSRLYERGRYSPTREAAMHHFHRLLARGWNRQFDS